MYKGAAACQPSCSSAANPVKQTYRTTSIHLAGCSPACKPVMTPDRYNWRHRMTSGCSGVPSYPGSIIYIRRLITMDCLAQWQYISGQGMETGAPVNRNGHAEPKQYI
jgi:hypothetical protein